MSRSKRIIIPQKTVQALRRWTRLSIPFAAVCLFLPIAAHGEPGAKKTLAGVAAGTGIAVMATNILTWLWGS